MSVHRLRGQAVDCSRSGCPVQVVSTVNRKDNEVSNDERPTISNEDRWKVLAECGPSQAQLADTIIRLRAEAAYWESEYDDCSTRYEAARGVVEALESLWREKQRLGDWTRATVTVKELRAALAASLPQPPTCIGNDPTCPCQDGDVCHYRDDPLSETLAWPVAASLPVPTEDQR